MKLISKIVLVAVAFMISSGAYAQKFGIINTGELITSMPDRDSVQVKLEAFSKELGQTLEAIQVEFNNKVNDYQKNAATLSETMKNLKEKELGDLQNRYEEFQQQAQQDVQRMQQQLMAPIIEKATNAIKTVCKAQGITYLFDSASGALAYYDEATVVNLLDSVKSELGIK